jgi:SAM-dependent methyltransferase
VSQVARDRAPVAHFERLARAAEDPWEYATSAYEQAKYRCTLDHLPERIDSALELGCSVGVFTEMLAPRCQRLLAVDFSPTALARARKRVAARANVELRRAFLPEETPAGPFSVIVCSEILYYWSPALVCAGLRRMEAALAPGGTLVAVHWRHGDPRRELDGDGVHAILRQRAKLAHRDAEASDDFLLDVWAGESPAAAERDDG